MRWINPQHQAGRAAQGRHRHSRQDRHRLHARPPDRRVPVGDADGAPERRSARSTARPARSTVNPETLFTATGEQRFVARRERRQELAGRRLQPADQHDVFPAAEHLHAGDLDASTSRRPTSLYGDQRASRRSRRARDKVGTVQAISVETGATTWKYEQRAGMMSLVATGGGLVFGGDVERPLPRLRSEDRARCCGR